VLEGTKLIRDVHNGVDYVYDAEDQVCGMVYEGNAYYFYKNLQGDVISITNAGGTEIARYSYDAWGVCTITGLTELGTAVANKNVFRYRSYIYDADLGWYYLQSRYYDPQVGRFINGDEVAYLGANETALSYNLFVYCESDPVNKIDRLGTASTFIDYQYGNYKIKYNNKMVRMRDIRWGSSGNIGDNGCGVIAAYNVFIGLGYDYMSFDKVLYQLSCMGAPLAGGLLGVDPTVLLDYMKIRFKNVSLEMGGNARNWNQTALNARAVIILYKYPSMAMHYVAGIKYRRSGCFRFYNAEYLRGRNVSVGAFIGCMMAHGLQMMSMICIY